MKKLEPRWRRSAFSQLPVRYIMTDLAEKNIARWRGHALLRSFVERCMLYFARFDAEAITYFHHSLDAQGAKRSTWHKMSMSYYRLRQLDNALRCMNESPALDPNDSPAESMRIKL